jgi:hypothetical protein
MCTVLACTKASRRTVGGAEGGCTARRPRHTQHSARHSGRPCTLHTLPSLQRRTVIQSCRHTAGAHRATLDALSRARSACTDTDRPQHSANHLPRRPHRGPRRASWSVAGAADSEQRAHGCPRVGCERRAGAGCEEVGRRPGEPLANAEGATRGTCGRVPRHGCPVRACAVQRLPSGLGARRVRMPPGPRRARCSAEEAGGCSSASSADSSGVFPKRACLHTTTSTASTSMRCWRTRSGCLDHQHPRTTSVCGPAPLLSTLSRRSPVASRPLPGRATLARLLVDAPPRPACSLSRAAHGGRATLRTRPHHHQRARGPDPSTPDCLRDEDPLPKPYARHLPAPARQRQRHHHQHPLLAVRACTGLRRSGPDPYRELVIACPLLQPPGTHAA